MFIPISEEQIIKECLIANKECKTCIYCAADVKIWEKLEKKFNTNSDFITELYFYYKIQNKRKNYEQKEKKMSLQLSEAEIPYFLRRY